MSDVYREGNILFGDDSRHATFLGTRMSSK